MTQLDDTHNGAIAEYCAQYSLSHFCQIVPVPRQEDYGVDFMCSLLHRDGKNLFAQGVLGLQVKTVGAAKDGIEYGGCTKAGVWRQHAVDTLLLTPIYPLLVGVVDIDKQVLALYTTFPIWRVRWKAGRTWKVILKPDRTYGIPKNDDALSKWSVAAGDPRGDAETPEQSDGRVWTVPLGPPIVTISGSTPVQPSSDTAKVLEWWVKFDQRNVTYQRMGVPFIYEVPTWQTNRIPNSVKPDWLGTERDGQNVNEILDGMAPMAVALKFNLELQNHQDDAAQVQHILTLAQKHGITIPPIPR